MTKKATINDVAKKAGVGKATVSRVLNTPHLVGKETLVKVMEAAKELGYKPNPIARALNNTRTRTVSLVVPNVESSTMAEIIRGAMQYLTEREYSLLVLDSSENYATERDYFHLLQERMTDGVIFCHGSAKERMEALVTIMPVVFVESMPKNSAIDRVLVDGAEAFRKMFRYLLACGFKEDIAIVYGKEDSFSNLRREQCELVLAEFKLNITPNNLHYGNWRPEDGYQSMIDLLAQKNRPKAVIYLSDVMALAGMRAAVDLGLYLPEDLSIVGFNDARFSAYYQPALTTLDYQPYKLGVEAARQILNRLEQPNLATQICLLDAALHIRESVRTKKNN
ncbi:MAG: LacI family DNA-binding transcriptional regulator [Clostridia bacterium]